MKKEEREAIKLLEEVYDDVILVRRTKKSHLVVLINGKVKTTIPSTPSDFRWIHNKISHINMRLAA
tara:strand:- start:51 stop:248 length:198 start_codon:yes stop_codon:yes gene_type:complete